MRDRPNPGLGYCYYGSVCSRPAKPHCHIHLQLFEYRVAQALHYVNCDTVNPWEILIGCLHIKYLHSLLNVLGLLICKGDRVSVACMCNYSTDWGWELQSRFSLPMFQPLVRTNHLYQNSYQSIDMPFYPRLCQVQTWVSGRCKHEKERKKIIKIVLWNPMLLFPSLSQPECERNSQVWRIRGCEVKRRKRGGAHFGQKPNV